MAETHLIDVTGRTVFRGTQKPPGGGSIPQGVLASDELLFTEAALAGPTFAITAVDQGAQTFTIAGDHTGRFPVPASGSEIPFVVTGSTGNDGTYHTTDVTLVGGNTVIVASEAIPDSTADGDLAAPTLYTASLPMLEGATVEDIRLYNLSGGFSTWAADVAQLVSIEDSTGTYYASVDLAPATPYALDNLYDPVGGSIDFTSVRSLHGGTRAIATDGTVPWEGTYANGGTNLFSILSSPDGSAIVHNPGGGGRRYSTDDTISLLVAAASAAPVVPVGALLVKIVYFAPVTAVDAVAS